MIKWFENDTLCGRYLHSDIEAFNRDFINVYETVRTDTNIVLFAEVKVPPNRPLEEMVDFLDNRYLISGNDFRLAIPDYRKTPLISTQHLRYMDLLERQHRYDPPPFICDGNMAIPRKVPFIQQPLYGEEFEAVLDFLNPLPVIETKSGSR